MDLLKSCIQLIVSGAERIDVEIVHALLLMYLVVVAALFLVRIIKGVRG